MSDFSGTASITHSYWNNECFLCSLFKGIFREPLCIFYQNIRRSTTHKSIRSAIKNVLKHFKRIEPSDDFVPWSGIRSMADSSYSSFPSEEIWNSFCLLAGVLGDGLLWMRRMKCCGVCSAKAEERKRPGGANLAPIATGGWKNKNCSWNTEKQGIPQQPMKTPKSLTTGGPRSKSQQFTTDAWKTMLNN